jgi:hypothetical protein
MINNIQANQPVSDSNLERSPQKGAENQSPPPVAAKEANSTTTSLERSDLRLVIEKDEAGILFVYRLIDPTTGNVVVEIPRKDLRKLGEAPNYRAGSVVRTEA